MVKALIAFKKAVASVGFKKAVAKIGFKKAIAEINLGDFLIFRFFLEALGLSDLQAKGVGKSLSDSQAVTDLTANGVVKGLSDNSGFADSATLMLSTVQSDFGETSDQIDILSIEKLLQNSFFVAESIEIQTAFNRSHTDAFTAAESINFEFGKIFSDASAFTDNESMAFGKSLADATVMTDLAVFSPNKIIYDSFLVAENQVMDFRKFIIEAFDVTDDLDGEATADDDQEMTFTKVRSNLATLVDIFAYSSTKNISDTMGASDSGLIRSQSYCSFDYFAEDYVGYSQQF